MAIIAMKKVSLVASYKHVKNILTVLQASKIFHFVPTTKKIPNIYLDDILKEKRNVTQRISMCHAIHNVLKTLNESENNSINADIQHDTIDYIYDLILEKKAILKNINRLEEDINVANTWGHVNVGDINTLENKLNIKFSFQIIKIDKTWSTSDKYLFTKIIQTKNNHHYVLCIHKNEQKDNGTSTIPQKDTLNDKLQLIKNNLKAIDNKITEFYKLRSHIQNTIADLVAYRKILDIKRDLYINNNIFGMQGFVPACKIPIFTNLFKHGEVAFIVEDPLINDKVPVLTKNHWLVKGFETVIRMFSGLSYYEKDITPIVGGLFIWFGALCFMDGGYGLLLSILGTLLIYKRIQDYGMVLLTTGLFTTFFGLINGQIFGLVVGQHIFKHLTPYFQLAINPFVCLKFSLIVGVCNVLGAFSVALWQRGFRTHASGGCILAFSTILYILQKTLNITSVFFNYCIYMSILSAFVLWVIYPETTFGEKNKIANICWTIYNGCVGLIQDTLSHMRLFGISLSGAILALVVNEISFLFPIYIQIPFCVILHIFVFVLSLLSLCVHTNRLIFLEFGSKCIEGGHFYYSPLGTS